MISDSIRDNGLAYATTHGAVVHICSQEPTNYAEVLAYSLGSSAVTVGAAQDGASNGRRVIVPSVAAGTVTSSGTATHRALVKTTATTELLATSDITDQAVTSGNTWTASAWSITIPD